MIYLSNIDLNKNELQNAVIQPLATAPSSPKLGQIYCDSANKKIKWYNGTSWEVVGVVIEDSATNGKIKVDGVEMEVYSLPTATTTTLGGVKIGTGLQMGDDGTLNVTGDAVPNQVPWSIVTGKNGKELSTNDYTTADKNKLAGIAAGAEVNVQSDWNATSGDALILNKPTTLAGYGITDAVKAVSGKGLSTKDYTAAEQTKLANIEEGAEANVQPDWNAESGDGQILNKPTKLSDFLNDQNFITKSVNNLTNYYTKTEVNNKFEALATITITPVTDFSKLPSTGAANVIYLVPKSSADGNNNAYDEYLWNTATTKYEKIGDTTVDLSSYAKTSDLTPFAKSADLKAVATSGSYNDLINKPTIKNASISTGTIAINATSGNITIASGKTVLNSWLTKSNGEKVICDITETSSKVTFSLASAATEAYTMHVAIV